MNDKKDTAYLNYLCDKDTYDQTPEQSQWVLSNDKNAKKGLSFFIFTDYTQPNLLGYSVKLVLDDHVLYIRGAGDRQNFENRD